MAPVFGESLCNLTKIEVIDGELFIAACRFDEGVFVIGKERTRLTEVLSGEFIMRFVYLTGLEVDKSKGVVLGASV